MIEAQEDLTWERWGNLIEATDRLGFDSLWRSDHLFSVMGAYERDALALWPSLTMVALRSSRIKFGPLVAPVTFRHPVMLARNAAALDRLSNGRFELGVGAGWNEAEHEAFGFDLPAPRDRINMLDEAIQVVQHLWTGDVVNFDGDHYQLRNAQMRPTPSHTGSVPLVIGAKRGKRMLKLVAAYADEWNITGGGLAREEYRDLQQTLARFCADINRDPGTIRRSIMLAYLIGRDQDELLGRAERMKAAVPSLKDIPTKELPDELRQRGWLVGQPDEIAQEIKSWEAVGVQRFMLQTHDQAELGAVELLATDVMPQVTDAAGQ